MRIASLAAYGHTVVPRAIRLFRDRHPDIAITFQIALSSQVRDLVVNGNFSLGLAADEVDLSGVDHRVFSSGRACCVMPPGHPLASRAVIRPADLDGLPFIALSAEDRARARFNAVLDAAGSRPNVVVETPFAATVCALALEGVGVGLAQAVAAEGFLERGLVLRPFEPEVYFRTYLLFRPDTQKSILVKHLVAALLAARDQGAGKATTPRLRGTASTRAR
nr:LysR substrate-binding domain-containing protein [Roseomonas sp. GC11]